MFKKLALGTMTKLDPSTSSKLQFQWWFLKTFAHGRARKMKIVTFTFSNLFKNSRWLFRLWRSISPRRFLRFLRVFSVKNLDNSLKASCVSRSVSSWESRTFFSFRAKIIPLWLDDCKWKMHYVCFKPFASPWSCWTWVNTLWAHIYCIPMFFLLQPLGNKWSSWGTSNCSWVPVLTHGVSVSEMKGAFDHDNREFI